MKFSLVTSWKQPMKDVGPSLCAATRQINAPKALTTSAVRYGFPMN